jgi:uncharacterized membrane protein
LARADPSPPPELELFVILAAVRDDTYNLFLLLHIVAALVAFAPTVRHAIEATLQAADRDGEAGDVDYTRMFSLGGLAAIFVTGIIMILVSDEVIEFSDTWISLSFLVWIAMGGVVSALVLKGQRMLAAGDGQGRSKVVLGNQITTLLVVVAVYLMVFKPGA